MNNVRLQIKNGILAAGEDLGNCLHPSWSAYVWWSAVPEDQRETCKLVKVGKACVKPLVGEFEVQPSGEERQYPSERWLVWKLCQQPEPVMAEQLLTKLDQANGVK